MYYVHENKCTGCGACMEGCPRKAIDLVDHKAHINQELCAQCGACQRICPQHAIIELEPPEDIAGPNWKAPQPEINPSRAHKNIPVFSKKQTGIAAAFTALSPVIIDAIHTFLQNRARRALKGNTPNKRQCSRLDKGLGRNFGRRGRGHGCRGKRRRGLF